METLRFHQPCIPPGKAPSFLFQTLSPGERGGASNQFVGLKPQPLGFTDCPTCETRSITCYESCPERNIQYNRTASLCAIATLATPWCLFIDKRTYCRCQPGSYL